MSEDASTNIPITSDANPVEASNVLMLCGHSASHTDREGKPFCYSCLQRDELAATTPVEEFVPTAGIAQGYAWQRRLASKKIATAQSALVIGELALAHLEVKILDAVVNEVDAEKKPVYSNTEKRKAEVARRLEESPDYQGLQKKLSDLRTIINESCSDVAYFADMVQICCSFAKREGGD